MPESEPVSQSGRSLITDEIAEKAARAAWEHMRQRIGSHDIGPFGGTASDREEIQRRWIEDTRAALEAVQGDIIEAFGASGHA